MENHIAAQKCKKPLKTWPGLNDYEVPHCGKAFGFFKRHMMLHTGVMSYS